MKALESALPLLPPRLVRFVEAARERLGRLHRRSVPAPVATLELVTAAWLGQAVSVAAKLGIADALAGGPRTLGELARSLACHEDALRRLLRALIQHGVFKQRADGRYEQSALSESLRRDVAMSVRNFALYVGSVEQRAHWSLLEQSIRSGEPSVPLVRGCTFFEYTREHPAFGALFNDAMTGLAQLAEQALLTHYDFTPFRRIVDVGGGRGRLLAAMLQRAPDAQGVLFDLAEVVEDAPHALRRLGVHERCTVESGSFFERVPSGGDLYVLKHILHDWPDRAALDILRVVRRAMTGDQTLLLYESILPSDGRAHLAALTDLEMLLSLGGRERTLAEFAALLAEAGFALTRVIETAAPISILEARPSGAV
jgi:C-methyltransferase